MGTPGGTEWCNQHDERGYSSTTAATARTSGEPVRRRPRRRRRRRGLRRSAADLVPARGRTAAAAFASAPGLRHRARGDRRRGGAARRRRAGRRRAASARPDRGRARGPQPARAACRRARRRRPAPGARCGGALGPSRCSSRPPRAAERVLVAMSGGVDSAVAAQLRARARRRGLRGHARALVGSGQRRRAELLLAAGRAAGALGRPRDGRPAPDRRSSRALPGRGRGAVPERLRGRQHPESLRALQRQRAARADDRDRRPARRRVGWRPATTRGSSTTARGRCWRRPPTGKGSGLHARRRCRPSSSPGSASRSGSCASPRSGGWPSAPGCPVAARPESQDLCFLAGEGKAGFLARHGGLARAQR